MTGSWTNCRLRLSDNLFRLVALWCREKYVLILTFGCQICRPQLQGISVATSSPCQVLCQCVGMSSRIEGGSRVTSGLNDTLRQHAGILAVSAPLTDVAS